MATGGQETASLKVERRPVSQMKRQAHSGSELEVSKSINPVSEGIVEHELLLGLKGDINHVASVSYSWAPFCDAELFCKHDEWVDLVECNSSGLDEYICCYRFTSVVALEKDLPRLESENLLAVILISDHNTKRTFEVDVFKERECKVPVLIVSGDDGGKLEELLRVNPGRVQVMAMLSAESCNGRSFRLRSSSSPQPTQFSLKGLLKPLLFPQRGVVCASRDSSAYKDSMIYFQHFEQQVAVGQLRGSDREEVARKALKLLLDKCQLGLTIPGDFPFYIGIIFRIHQNESAYKCSLTAEFASECIRRIERLNPVVVADVMKGFLSRRNFNKIQVDVRDSTYTPYSLLERGCESILESTRSKSRFIPVMRGSDGRQKPADMFYRRLFWVTLIHKTRSEMHSVTTQDNVWHKYLHKVAESSALDHRIVDGLKTGLLLGKLIELPPTLCVTTQQMFDLISPDKLPPNPLSIVSYAVKAIEPYLHSEGDFISAIRRVRMTHKSCLSTPSKIREYLKRVLQEDLREAIRQGLKFLDMIYEISQAKRWSKSQFLMESKEWIAMLLSLVDVTHQHAELYYSVFLQSSLHVAQMHHEFVESEIVQQLKDNAHRLSVESFCTMYRTFVFIPKQFVSAYLEGDRVPQSLIVSDAIWQDLLKVIVERLPGSMHYDLVCGFLEKAGDYYQRSKRDANFLQDLLKLNVRGLLQPSPDDPSATEVPSQKIVALVRTNLEATGLSGLQQVLPMILESGVGQDLSYFQEQLLQAVVMELASKSDLLKGSADCTISKSLKLVVEFVCKDASTDFASNTAYHTFCWNLICKCCRRIAVHEREFNWIESYSHAITVLGQPYMVYCGVKEKSGSECILQDIPSAIGDNALVKPYFVWIQSIHSFLVSWNDKMSGGHYTYSELIQYRDSYLELNTLVQAVAAICTLLPSETVTRRLHTFGNEFDELNKVLVPNVTITPKFYYRNLCDLLPDYGVELPMELKSMISEVVLSPRSKAIEGSVVTFQPQVTDEPLAKRNLGLQLAASATQYRLTLLLAKLNDFRKPIAPYILMLVVLQRNHIFRQYLALQQQKVASQSVCAAVQSDALQLFHSSLQRVHILLERLVEGSKITYREITAEGLLNLEDIDLHKELHEISFFFNHSSEKGLRGIRCLLEIFQFAHHIARIHDVCKKYKLENCLTDPELQDLVSILDEIQDDESKANLKLDRAVVMRETIVRSLCLPHLSETRCLKIFPVMLGCMEFFIFIQEKFFGKSSERERDSSSVAPPMPLESARATFQQLFEIITQQLQHEDYNEQVLNQLHKAFRFILPFMNPDQTLRSLVTSVMLLEPTSGFQELKTATENINLIRLWFARAEGDTLENVSKELEYILSTGHYHFSMTSSTQVAVSLVFHCSPIVVRKPTASSSSKLVETWSSEKIENLVRKLGLLDSQEETEEKIQRFLQLNETAYKLLDVRKKLVELGFYQRNEFADSLPCSTPLSEAEEKLFKAEAQLISWQDEVERLHHQHKWLLFFTVPKLLNLAVLLRQQQPNVISIAREVGFLFQNNQTVRNLLDTEAIQEALEGNAQSEQSPMGIVGHFLDQLMERPKLAGSTLPRRISDAAQPPVQAGGILHIVAKYTQSHQIRLMIDVLRGVPESFDMFRCCPSTSEGELRLFMKRVKYYPRQYILLEVNQLPYHLQEVLMRLYLDARPLESTLHFFETASSIFREVPWIQVKDYKEAGPSLSFPDARELCLETVKKFVTGKSSNVTMFYGLPGQGKTHHVCQMLKKFKHKQTIAVNEAFTRQNAIAKLNQLPRNDEDCAIFFNFSMLAPGGAVHQSERESYNHLLSEVGWFFFELFILGYVEDPASGQSFQFPYDLGWEVFVEVPSEHPEVEPEANMAAFQEKAIPALGLIAGQCHVDPRIPYSIDEDVRLVCKYLRAYSSGEINALYIDAIPPVDLKLPENLSEKDFTKHLHSKVNPRGLLKSHLVKAYMTKKFRRLIIQGTPITFGGCEDPSDSECRIILENVMCEEVQKWKIMQKLFIGYMTRRCRFLESCPGFFLNSGVGVPVDRGRSKHYPNTVLLGSTLMAAMLQEVNEICSQTQNAWGLMPCQQLIYDFRGGGGAIGLISRNPNDLPDHAEFERIGVEIPTANDMHSREVLDAYLSRALNVPLDDNGHLAPVDECGYVLTLDYTIKMLNINERYQCGSPVIIEGETGVGKTALVEMLSKLWNHAWLNEWKRDKGGILDLIRRNIGGLPPIPGWAQCVEALQNFSAGEVLKEEMLEAIVCLPDATTHGEDDVEHDELDERTLAVRLESTLSLSLAGSVRFSSSLGSAFFASPLHQQQESPSTFQRTLREMALMLQGSPLLHLLDFPSLKTKSSIDDLFEAVVVDEHDTKALSRLLYVLLNAKVKTAFHKLNVDAALKPAAIKDFFGEVCAQAKELQEIFHHCRDGRWSHYSGVPFVTAYLDEVNTSSCLGLFKEIIVDGTIDGEELPKNLFIIASCNPHRGNSLVARDTLTYYVRQLHPTLDLLKWDYGALDEYQEQEYVAAKMTLLQKELVDVRKLEAPEIACLTELIVESQKRMREYAKEQLGEECPDADLRSKSCVSQRDIQRVFTFYQWLMETYVNSSVTHHQSQPEYHRRAVLVSLGVVYYMRLSSTYRDRYESWLDEPLKNLSGEITFGKAFQEELDWYAERVELPPGIAKTQALKENLFATIICCVTRTPLIIEGAPGSSKTLSFNIVVSNLKGKESKIGIFQEAVIFHALDPHFYQCSRRTTSDEIKIVFKRALNRQRSQRSSPTQTYCVVFMDEAGLPEAEFESLKALHYYLDNPEVSFVAITNHPLDAAKTNRAVSLYRSESSEEDLKTLAKECLKSDSVRSEETVERFCEAYSTLMTNREWMSFFGLRDFIYFLTYLRCKYQSRITYTAVLAALERNFGGTPDFSKIRQLFINEKEMEAGSLTGRNVLQVLRESLNDRALSSGDVFRLGIQSEVRYKLIIDPSEDGSLLRLLFGFGIFDATNTKVFICSDAGNSRSEVNTILNIRHSAFKGETVLLCQTDRIHECFYDLFNQRFRCISDRVHGPRYYANIAIGAHTKPSCVSPTFQCAVVLTESETRTTPSPFLNRFEKYLLSYKAAFDLVLQTLPSCMKVVVQAAYNRVREFIELLEGPKSFYGLAEESTLYSLLLSILPLMQHEYHHLNSAETRAAIQPCSDIRLFLLQTLLYGLRRVSGFCFAESLSDLQRDVPALFEIVEQDPEFKEIMSEMDEDEAEASVDEALEVLHCFPGPEENMGSCSTHTDSCLVIAVLQQWLVRYLCRRLMQVMTPEALAIHQLRIPNSYCVNYLMHQYHFSLKDLISSQFQLLQTESSETQYCPTKLLCYTRSSPVITQKVPVQYPSKLYTSGADSSNFDEILRDLICDDVGELVVCKVTSTFTHSNFEKLLNDFVAQEQEKVFLVVANMQDVARNIKKVVNHIRISIETAETQYQCRGKLFVVLLHFPPVMFFDPCYPSMFLRGWDHHYLDTIMHVHFKRTHLEKSPLDIELWFKRLCLPSPQPVEEGGAVVGALTALQEEAIPVITSRTCFGSRASSFFNRSMDGIERSKNIKRLLDTGVGDILCKRFSAYWRPKVMIEYIRRAAEFTYTHESTLNLTDSVQTAFKSLFFDFMVYMISRMNEHFSIDLLFDGSSELVQQVFLNVLQWIPVPELAELQARSSNLTVPTFTSVLNERQCLRFPFFKDIFRALDSLLDKCREHVNQQIEDAPGDKVSQRSKYNREKMLVEVGQEQLHTVLQEWQVQCVTTVCNAMSASENSLEDRSDLWRRYLDDFICHEFLLSAGALTQDFSIPILKDYFLPLEQESNMLTRLLSLHALVHVHKLTLARATALLRTLNRLDFALPPTDPQGGSFSLSQANHKAGSIIQNRQEDLAIYIIDRLFATLHALFRAGRDIESLRTWHKGCQDVLTVTALKESLYRGIPLESATKFTILYVTLMVMQCMFGLEECYSKAEEMYNKMCSIYIDSEEDGEKRAPQLVEVILIGVSILAPVTTMKRFLEGVLNHFFSEYLDHYQPVDCKWFIQLANKQWDVPPTTVEFLECHKVTFTDSDTTAIACCLSWNVYKFFLSRILGSVGDSDSHGVVPVLLHRAEVRTKIGAILTADPSHGAPSPYFSVFYQQFVPRAILPELHPSEVMQQPLAHMYFEIFMEHLIGHDSTLIRLQGVVSAIEAKLSESESPISVQEKCVLLIEKQAVLQVILHSIAENPDPTIQRVITTRVMGKLAEVFEQQSLGGAHALVLALHLLRSKPINSYNKLLQLLINDRSTIRREITCLSHLQPLLPAEARCDTHLFPFTVQEPTPTQLGRLYQDVCSAALKFHTAKDGDDILQLTDRWCVQPVMCDGLDGVSAFKMTLWLCVYYEFYDKLKQSRALSRLISKRLRGILDDNYVQLVCCFLEPKNMDKSVESPLPSNPDAPLFQVTAANRIVPVPQSGQRKHDPIHDLFNPKNFANQEQSEVSLRHALANLVAAIVGCPPRTHHLWYHMFSADELENSFVTGFMYKDKIKPGRLYDCGVELSADGDYGRSDYLQHSNGSVVSLHSRYLLLWANFGAFCISLLTQRHAQRKLRDHVISSWQPLRHYCLSQLHTVWIHMRNNLGLSCEEQSFLIMRSMQRLIEHAASNPERLRGKIETQEELDEYEKLWEMEIFAPSKDELAHKYDEYCQELSSEQLLYKHLKLLGANYPTFPNENDLRHAVEQIPGVADPNHELHLLSLFVREQLRLRAGAAILPDLVEFYQWLHTEVAYTLSRRKAVKATIKEVVVDVARKYGDERGDNLINLYKRVKSGYNHYVRVIGGAIGVGACANVRRENPLNGISDSTNVLHFLSETEEEGGGNDCLFLVIADIIGAQNAILQSISCSRVIDGTHLESCFKDMAKIHPTELDDHTCVMGGLKQQHGISWYEQLIRSRFESPAGMGRAPTFNLRALQMDILEAYFAGKPTITEPNSIRNTFKFKEKHSSVHRFTDLALDLKTVERLPQDFKAPLDQFKSVWSGDHYSRMLEFEFHSADYNKMLEVVTGLINAAEHLCKVLEEDKLHEESCFTGGLVILSDMTLPGFLHQYVYKGVSPEEKEALLSEIGINNLRPSELECLAELKMEFIYSTLVQFKEWIESGLYDFYTLPIAMKKHLSAADSAALEQIPMNSYYRGLMQRVHLLETNLKALTDALLHAESYLQGAIMEMAHKPLVQYLQEIHVVGADNHLCNLIPQTVRVEHYVDLRITLRRLLDGVQRDLTDSSRSKPANAEKRWNEVVGDLWSERLKHIREMATRFQRQSEFVLDIETGRWGFQEWSSNEDSDTDSGSDDEEAASPQNPSVLEDLVKLMKVEDVQGYLHHIGLEVYAAAFKSHDIDGHLLLPVLNDEDALKQLGVKSALDKIKLTNTHKLLEYIREKCT